MRLKLKLKKLNSMNNVSQGAVDKLRHELFLEINSKRVNIDRSVFSKTPEEKKVIREIKQQHRKNLRKAGIDPNKRYMKRILLVTT